VFRWLVLVLAGSIQTRARLIAENACLRQQLVILKRRQKRPSLRDADRRFWILSSRWFGHWRETLLIVQPETVIRWHRKG
jgi:putative transposase